jgi:hypothetical protein
MRRAISVFPTAFFCTKYPCLQLEKRVVSESDAACTDCDPAFIYVFADDWVTVGAIDFLVEAICDRRLRQPHFTSQLQVL